MRKNDPKEGGKYMTPQDLFLTILGAFTILALIITVHMKRVESELPKLKRRK